MKKIAKCTLEDEKGKFVFESFVSISNNFITLF